MGLYARGPRSAIRNFAARRAARLAPVRAGPAAAERNRTRCTPNLRAIACDVRPRRARGAATRSAWPYRDRSHFDRAAGARKRRCTGRTRSAPAGVARAPPRRTSTKSIALRHRGPAGIARGRRRRHLGRRRRCPIRAPTLVRATHRRCTRTTRRWRPRLKRGLARPAPSARACRADMAGADMTGDAAKKTSANGNFGVLRAGARPEFSSPSPGGPTGGSARDSEAGTRMRTKPIRTARLAKRPCASLDGGLAASGADGLLAEAARGAATVRAQSRPEFGPRGRGQRKHWGTDHGTGGASLPCSAGRRSRGRPGVIADWPGLAEARIAMRVAILRITTDLARAVMKSVPRRPPCKWRTSRAGQRRIPGQRRPARSCALPERLTDEALAFKAPQRRWTQAAAGSARRIAPSRSRCRRQATGARTMPVTSSCSHRIHG